MIDNYQKLEKRIAELEEKVRRIETRNRGYLTQSAAAAYLGRSAEFLREYHAHGIGPERLESGMYSINALDEWVARKVGRVKT